MDKKEQFIELLKQTKRDGIENLITWMEKNGFFESPCSCAFHLSKEGGLVEHSINVYNTLVILDDALCANIPAESMLICALLHDLGKAGDHGKHGYVPNMIKSKTKNKETGEYDIVQSAAKPFETNKHLTYEEHEIRSLLIAERFIYLSEEEETAILHHNGLYGKLDSSYGTHNYDKTKLAFLLHTADMYCSRFSELEQKDEYCGLPFVDVPQSKEV